VLSSSDGQAARETPLRGRQPLHRRLSRMDGTHPRDNSRSTRSIWCSTHCDMPASTPGSARSSGQTGNGYRSSPSVARIHAEHPGVACELIELTCCVGSKAVRRNPAPSTSLRSLTGSSNPGSTTMSARHLRPESSRELGTLENVEAVGELISPLAPVR
jgi:hypothetical protein